MSLWIKIVAVCIAIAALVGAVHLYNESLVSAGKAEVELNWSKATAKQAKDFANERRRIEGERDALAKKYGIERQARVLLEGQLDKERADAIAESAVAGNVCIDDRMRDVWNRANGHGGVPGKGKAR